MRTCLIAATVVASFLSSPLALAVAGDFEKQQEALYLKSVAKFSQDLARGKVLPSPRVFKKMSWVERTAALKVACTKGGAAVCRKAIDMGLSDSALVVRDQALVLLAACSTCKLEDKTREMRRVIADENNYRKGAPLWIVERAHKWLNLQKETNVKTK